MSSDNILNSVTVATADQIKPPNSHNILRIRS